MQPPENAAGRGMTELHNMSVPPRSTVTLQREELHGRRYRVARLEGSPRRPVGPIRPLSGRHCAARGAHL